MKMINQKTEVAQATPAHETLPLSAEYQEEKLLVPLGSITWWQACKSEVARGEGSARKNGTQCEKEEKFFAQHLKFGITVEIPKKFLNYHLKTPESLERSARATKKAEFMEAAARAAARAERMAAAAKVRAKANQAAALKRAEDERTREERRSARLEKQFEDNELLIAAKQEQLRERLGTLSELFGHLTAASGDLASNIEVSLISSEYPDREGFLKTLIAKMTGSDQLPKIAEIERVWFELLREIREQGEKIGRAHV